MTKKEIKLIESMIYIFQSLISNQSNYSEQINKLLEECINDYEKVKKESSKEVIK